MSQTTIMTTVRLPDRIAALLAETKLVLKISKTDVIIRAIEAFCAPDRHADRVIDIDAFRQRDLLLCELGRLGSQQRSLGGLLALAVKRDGGMDVEAVEQNREKLMLLADQFAAAANQILTTGSDR